MTATLKKHHRRSADQLVADLEAQIEALKARKQRKRAKADPSMRYTVAAVRTIEKAMAVATDGVLRKTLEEARGGLAAYLTLQGVVPAARARAKARVVRQSPGSADQAGASLFDYVSQHPGQRGGHIAAAMGTDARGIRPSMQGLIAEGRVRTVGVRRGMRYYAV